MRKILSHYGLTLALLIAGVSLFIAGLAISQAGHSADHAASAARSAEASVHVAAAASNRAVALAHAVQTQEAQTAALARAIANERAFTIFTTCQQQNARHAATIRELDQELRQIKRHLPRRRWGQLNASRRFTALLIDQLAPYQNCHAVLAAFAKS